MKAGPDVDAGLKTYAADALKADLAARPEWASDIGPRPRPAADRSALVAELNKRKLRGFDVTVRIETFKKEMKDPQPGGRLKQLAINMQLVVIGATIPDAKLAFNGTGEAGVEAEVSEKRMATTPPTPEGRHQGRDQAGGRSGGPEAVARRQAGAGKRPAKKKT